MQRSPSGEHVLERAVPPEGGLYKPENLGVPGPQH
jgi:hypothetical protein